MLNETEVKNNDGCVHSDNYYNNYASMKKIGHNYVGSLIVAKYIIFKHGTVLNSGNETSINIF